MGGLTGDRVVTVDSVVYNLAGPEEHRPDYLKTVIAGNVLSGTKNSMGDSIRNAYLGGPAAKFKSFYRWAQKPENYSLIGRPSGKISTMAPVSAQQVQTAFARIYGGAPWIQRAQVGEADLNIWVEQWMLENRPDLIDEEWYADIPAGSNAVYTTFPDLGSPGSGGSFASFIPQNYEPGAKYVYAWYNRVTGDNVGPVTTGAWNDIGTADFPSTSGWVYEGGPSGTVIKTTSYSKLTYLGGATTGGTYLRETMYFREEVGPPVARSWRIDSQTYTGGLVHEHAKVFIYKIGSGDPDLDQLVPPETSMGEFFPFIPARLNNVFLSEDYLPGEFKEAKKAYKKATGAKYADLIDKIADNASLNEIDHAYVVFGVSLNVKENACRRYLWRFFERLALSQIGGPSVYASWKSAVAVQQGLWDAWFQWKNNQNASAESGMGGGPEPLRPLLPSLPKNSIRIQGKGTGTYMHYDMTISWAYIDQGTGSGLGKPTAKKGDVWLEVVPVDPVMVQMFVSGDFPGVAQNYAPDCVRIWFQESATVHRWMDIVGATHSNLVYGFKNVLTRASLAVQDTEESGFIIPLHYDIWREVSLIEGTQMVTASTFIVFNCYKIKKTKWYESGVFRIIIVIVIAIVSVVLTGGAGIGLLGTHLAVGTALGFTGMAAAILGSIINAFAALILSTFLQMFGNGLFGEQFGAIFAAVVMFVVGQFSSGAWSTTDFTINWGDFVKVDNLLKLTNIFGQAYASAVNAGTAQIGKDMQSYEKDSKAEAEKIQQAFFDEFGYGAGKIDPMMFVDIASSARILAESSDTFLTRTLMTGSEIAELSRDLIYNFVDYSNKLPDAFV